MPKFQAVSRSKICTGEYNAPRGAADDWSSESWLPYVQLSRLNPPISWFLVFLPELFGILHAASSLKSSGIDVLRVVAVVLVHSFFVSNAGVAWNDVVDADIDAKVKRTQNRPIPRGAISRGAAFLFVCSQVVLAGACLLPLPRAASVAMIPIVVATAYYPLAKRQMPAPQLVIKFCMGWAVTFGRLSMGHDGHWTDRSILCLMGATALWTILCDTVYAHQDLADDCKIGVKSLAVLAQGYAKSLLWLLLVAMITLLYYSNPENDKGVAYNLISVAGCSLFTATMLTLVDLKNSASCEKWAGSSFGFTGFLIASGLLASYLAY